MIGVYVALVFVGLALALGGLVLWIALDFDDLERISRRQAKRPPAKSTVPVEPTRTPAPVASDA